MRNSVNEKKTVVMTTIVICLILLVYLIVWLIGTIVFWPLIIGFVMVLISGICIIKCMKDRLKEIEEEKDDLSKY